jgi:hypothetical protein
MQAALTLRSAALPRASKGEGTRSELVVILRGPRFRAGTLG